MDRISTVILGTYFIFSLCMIIWILVDIRTELKKITRR